MPLNSPNPVNRIEQWETAEARSIGSTRSINFPHNDGYLICAEAGIKLGTLHRKSERYQFEAGEAFQLRCDAEGAAVNCKVLGVQVAPMKEIDPVLLAVDGFLDYQTAFERMCLFYNRPETPFTDDTEMIYVTFMAEGLFDCLNPSAKLTLMKSEPQVSFREPDMRPIVFRSIAYWHAMQGATALQYLGWLLQHELIEPSDFDGVVASMRNGRTSGDTRLTRLAGEKFLAELRDPLGDVSVKLVEMDF